MEEEKIKGIFAEFQPELPGDELFMARLENRLNNVEYIRRKNLSTIKRSRRAAVIAALVGVAAGLLLSLAVPYVMALLPAQAYNIPTAAPTMTLGETARLTVWAIVAATSALLAVNAYHLASAPSRTKG